MENIELLKKMEEMRVLKTAILSDHMKYFAGTTEDETLRIKGGR
jgi:hypothetical protein